MRKVELSAVTMHMYSFAGLKRQLSLLFIDTAITNCHPDTVPPAQNTLCADILGPVVQN